MDSVDCDGAQAHPGGFAFLNSSVAARTSCTSCGGPQSTPSSGVLGHHIASLMSGTTTRGDEIA